MLKKEFKKNLNLKRKFRCSYYLYFFFSFLVLFLGKYLYYICSKMLHYNHDDHSSGSSAHSHSSGGSIKIFLFPEFFYKVPFLKNFIDKISVSLNFFCYFGFFLAVLFSLSFFLKYFFYEQITINSSSYICDLSLEKFRSLPYEERTDKASELRHLLNKDAENLAYNWHRLPVKFTVFFLGFFLDFLFWMNRILNISFSQFFFFSLAGIIFFFVFNAIVKKKEQITKEWRKKRILEVKDIQKEIELTNLADSMGVKEQLKAKRSASSLETKNYALKNVIFSPLEYIPGVLSKYLFPFFLLLLSGDLTNTIIIHVMIDCLSEVDSFGMLMKEFQEYAVSKKVLDNFLALGESEENLEGFCPLNTVAVEEIIVEDLGFKYKKQETPLLQNYHHVFFSGKINYVKGQNGIGKSTLIRLLLGVLKPFSGRIIVRFSDGLEYDLFSQLNLKHWREKNICFLSHRTLFEEDEGSTGQRQWKNINQSLETKDSLIWIFDEADNALDKEKQEKIEKKMKELVDEKKLVIYIRHKEIPDNE